MTPTKKTDNTQPINNESYWDSVDADLERYEEEHAEKLQKEHDEWLAEAQQCPFNPWT